MLNTQELYQQANQLPPLEKLRLAELLLADLEIIGDVPRLYLNGFRLFFTYFAAIMKPH